MKRSSVTFWSAAICFILYSGSGFSAVSDELKETANTPGIHLKDGAVPDEKTAVAIAVAVWTPVYGAEQIAKEKPYNAVLHSGNWTVTGSLPNGWVGGVATAVISKLDGRIIKIYHTK